MDPEEPGEARNVQEHAGSPLDELLELLELLVPLEASRLPSSDLAPAPAPGQEDVRGRNPSSSFELLNNGNHKGYV